MRIQDFTLDGEQLVTVLGGGDALSCARTVITDTVLGGGGSAVIGGAAGAVTVYGRAPVRLGVREGAKMLGKWGAIAGGLIGLSKCL